MLDEAEPPERLATNIAHELSGGARTAASFRILLAVSLRHGRPACHSELVTANAAKRLIEHYVDNFRKLPWRSPPGEAPQDVYRVWLSEVMLQQTTVEAVRPRFERFVARWPTVEALASAKDEDVLHEWAGLGYYARARNLIWTAREVTRRGRFPRTARELRELPGVGAYTSAAIAAIAFGERSPAVDTNVRRVVARLSGWKQPSRPEIETVLTEMLHHAGPGDFIQAMMDLGATICRPRNPGCGKCPLTGECKAFISNAPEKFPGPRERTARLHRSGLAYWTERDDHLWLVRRPKQGLLGGMPALPGSEWGECELPDFGVIGTIRHVFTHFSLELHLVRRAEPQEPGWWQPFAQLDSAGLPTLYHKAVKSVLSSHDSIAA